MSNYTITAGLSPKQYEEAMEKMHEWHLSQEAVLIHDYVSTLKELTKLMKTYNNKKAIEVIDTEINRLKGEK